MQIKKLSKIENDTENKKKKEAWDYRITQENYAVKNLCDSVWLEYVIIRDYHSGDYSSETDYTLEIHINGIVVVWVEKLNMYIYWYKTWIEALSTTNPSKPC
jgi:hypothetical protein